MENSTPSQIEAKLQKIKLLSLIALILDPKMIVIGEFVYSVT